MTRYPKAPDVDVGGGLSTYQAIADAWFEISGQRISRCRVQQICRRVEGKLRKELEDFAKEWFCDELD